MTSKSYGPDTTTDEVLAGIDLSNKISLVTGASGGIGLETARALASKGARVILGVRDQKKGKAAMDTITHNVPGADILLKELDLASLESVRTFANSFLAEFDQLNILIANAGVMCPPLQRTEEGFELQFGTNHLGHFVLVCKLVPALINASSSRVVMVSSAGHRFGDINFDDINYNNRPYEKWPAYGQSKTANILFTVELNRRLSKKGVTANALHPGAIMTDLSRHLTKADMEGLDDVSPGEGEIHWKSVQAGAATSVWAATAPELEGKGGLYLEDCQISSPISSAEEPIGFAPYAIDPASARRLWTLSEEMVGEQFSF